MYFGLFKLVLLLFTTINRSQAWKIRVNRLHNGVDHFELLDDEKKSICTTTKKATEFCAKHGAVAVKNSRSCPDNQESLCCRCNSTKSTFLLHEERCVNQELVARYLDIGTFSDCKFYLAVQDGTSHPRCGSTPVPTLLTSTSQTLSFSICTENTLQEVTSCKVSTSNSLYFNIGRWRQMWTPDAMKTVSGLETNLETMLQKLSSNDSRWSGFIVFLQTTCLVKPGFSLMLRGQAPPEQVQSCLLLKIGGSHMWSLKSHQLNLTQPSEINFHLTRNQTSRQGDHNRTDSRKEVTTTPQHPTTATYDYHEDSEQWTPGLLGAIFSFLFFLIVVITLWVIRDEYRSRIGRKKPTPRRSAGNPTYERGHDNSLTLTPIAEPSPYAVSPCVQAYQPIVENTRPHSVNGCNNLYESLRSIRENTRPRAVTLYQDLNTTRTISGVNSIYEEVILPLETAAENPPSVSFSNFAEGVNSNEHCESNSTPPQIKQKLRSKSVVLDSKEIHLDTKPATCSLPAASDRNVAALDSNKECDLKSMSSTQTLVDETAAFDGEDCPLDEPRVGELTVICQSNSLSSLQENETVQHQSDIADSCSTISSDSDTIRDSLHDDLSDCGLSGLEIVIDSDYSENDEIENQSDKSDPFYYVLEGPNPT